MLKINSKIGKVAGLNYVCDFSEKQIYIAKKCIMNKLTMPPNYEMGDLKVDDVKSVVSQSIMSHMSEKSF